MTGYTLLAGLIKYSELTEYLVRAVTGMQKELQEARCEASRMSARCVSLESEIQRAMGQEEKSQSLQSENERVRRHLCSLQHEVTKLKDEKCDLYMRYTAAIEEKSAVNMRLHDLNLQVSDPDVSFLLGGKKNSRIKERKKKEPVAPQRCRRLVFMLRKAAIMKSLLACSVANVPLFMGFPQ